MLTRTISFVAVGVTAASLSAPVSAAAAQDAPAPHGMGTRFQEGVIPGHPDYILWGQYLTRESATRGMNVLRPWLAGRQATDARDVDLAIFQMLVAEAMVFYVGYRWVQ